MKQTKEEEQQQPKAEEQDTNTSVVIVVDDATIPTGSTTTTTITNDVEPMPLFVVELKVRFISYLYPIHLSSDIYLKSTVSHFFFSY